MNADELAGVRDPEALAVLPEDERAAWQAFWREVQGWLPVDLGQEQAGKNFPEFSQPGTGYGKVSGPRHRPDRWIPNVQPAQSGRTYLRKAHASNELRLTQPFLLGIPENPRIFSDALAG
jgi:hypothetical protein